MSYDFWIEMGADRTGEPVCQDPHALPVPEGVPDAHPGFCGNYTSNVWRMWDTALGDAHDEGAPFIRWIKGAEKDGPARRGLHALSGERAGDCVELLDGGVRWMVENADQCREWEPENGWGDYEGALAYLAQVAEWCRAVPDGTLRISA